ncbi:Amidohydrolase [Symmachiella macrocystis]|uniref:Amidohydrolase n=1 Tax=Symmachiella macrocystis TaxID=2527985 RepID=A0A5C6BLT6_9PLAN|nr:amidohydrolase family protein [Symmachiella macrocystis]TWU13143.1 Amidohydrolase [Symmachiella macrocystis]
MTNSSGSTLLRPCDREFYERELASFLPDRIYDAHCHLGKSEFAPALTPAGYDTVGYAEYRQLMTDLHPGADLAALFLPIFSMQHRDRFPDASAWVAQEVVHDPRCRGEFFIAADDDPEWVRDEVRRLGLHGLKCYHITAATQPTWDAQIPDFLPEPLVKVAHEEELVITLHMVRSRAVADPQNIHWIRHYCATYPGMRLILAHSARGFQPAHNLEGLPHLKGLDNLYFDTSANCEPIAHQAIIRILGHERLMYGSDVPVSHLRGRSLGAADSFVWLYEETPVWGEKHNKIEPVLIGLEHLRSIKWACWSERLSDSAVEDIFWNNAARMLGVE